MRYHLFKFIEFIYTIQHIIYIYIFVHIDIIELHRIDTQASEGLVGNEHALGACRITTAKAGGLAVLGVVRVLHH